MNIEKLTSRYDGLLLEVSICMPQNEPKGIIAFSHGMAEHKERYFPFMKFLSDHGYVCVIHDHRGHGKSVKSQEDYGYFYTEDEAGIVDDLHTVISVMKERYPDIPCYLFSHSMGTLVARCYMKKYDAEIDKLVLCGPPTKNPAVGTGLLLAKIMKPFARKKSPNNILNNIAFQGYNDGNELPFGWLSVNDDNVHSYNQDPLCGFVFTTNGFVNLFKLQKGAFEASDWSVKNSSMPVFVIAGEKDPVIQSQDKFTELVSFLKGIGYQKVKSRLYENMRHEILNEKQNEIVYKDVLAFFEKE